jgi:hypothetical protein
VFGRKKHKTHKSHDPRDDHERFYLLPGQGGRNYFRKQKTIMCWTVAASLVFGTLLTAILWWLSHPRP